VCLGAGVLILIGGLVVHDEILNRRECRPFIAEFKAKEIATGLRLGWDEVSPTVAGVADERVEVLGDGRFDVRIHVRARRHGSDWSPPMPLRCTMKCGGLDDWVLENYQLDGDPVVRCDIQLSPGGLANRLWIRRLARALGAA
jgi:hypothetical protein